MWRFWDVFVVFGAAFAFLPYGLAQDLMCCSHATGSCRSVCEKISLVQLAADRQKREETVQEVQKYCSPQLHAFWECLNATFKDISRGESWSGRLCCPLPQSESCRNACITATSTFDLAQGCRQSDEIAFFSCLDRQKEGETCCGNATIANEECRLACFDIFHTQLTPNKMQRQRVQDKCESSNPNVMECVKEFVKVTPAKNLHKHLHCCDLSINKKCQDSCKRILATKTITIQEIIDGLQTGGCGPPLPQEYFWQCFLKPSNEPSISSSSTSVEVSRIERVGMDSAKWHCCQRASTDQCQRLCTKTFTKFWTTLWDEFLLKCLSHVHEENLRTCIDEVDEPCELGCDGLSFCTNFNNRPTELFRSCNSLADEAARNSVADWSFQNNISLPGLVLPLRSGGTQCSPIIWKAVACTLHIKPCSRHSHGNQICRDVCLGVLSKCVEWSQVPPHHTAESICATLSPDDPQVPCIRLESFLSPSDVTANGPQVLSPCKGDPCESNEICLVNKNCIHSNGKCLPYTCVPACKLGEVSEYMVPDGAFVRIPIATNNNPKGCLKICKCNRGRIEECQPLPCVSLTPCLLGGLHQMHGTSFNMDCNSCSCFAGEVICSKKQCETSVLSGRNTAYTTMPCNCSPHYVPVCGRDGNTYPSACLAKCAGLTDSDIDRVPCEDPCQSNKCPIGHKCVPQSQVCLSLMHKPCKQFICVNGTTNCRNLPLSPVCDIHNVQHDNACVLAHHNAKLAYHGPCLQHCRHDSGRVCGFNGRTYRSECAAWADSVAVDYTGPCMAVGLITDKKSRQCAEIQCKPLPKSNCFGITPPGACCPICGGAMRLLYSRKQIDRALYALQNQNTAALTLQAMLKALERQIQVAQCSLRGYLTVEQDIFVAVESIERFPSEVQLEACVREAEKIASLINMQSPRIVSELSLSSLTLANVVHTQRSSGVKVEGYYGLVIALVLIVVI